MPSLRELRKHLRSINTTEQLAGAMKTVSAAKYSRIGGILERYRTYAAVCRELTERFGSALAEQMPCANPEAPVCYVVMAANRGLCGGYNIALLEYADDVLAKEEKPYRLVACGKAAISHFEGKADRGFLLPDVPDYESCAEFGDYLRNAYRNGEVSEIRLIYQNFVNMLTQVPVTFCFLPLGGMPDGTEPAGDDILFIPDRNTVLKSACESCVSSLLYSVLLDCTAGAQAATLMAMRSAYDNAKESTEALETLISRKRQSEVTASVLETSSDNNSMNQPQ